MQATPSDPGQHVWIPGSLRENVVGQSVFAVIEPHRASDQASDLLNSYIRVQVIAPAINGDETPAFIRKVSGGIGRAVSSSPRMFGKVYIDPDGSHINIPVNGGGLRNWGQAIRAATSATETQLVMLGIGQAEITEVVRPGELLAIVPWTVGTDNGRTTVDLTFPAELYLTPNHIESRLTDAMRLEPAERYLACTWKAEPVPVTGPGTVVSSSDVMVRARLITCSSPDNDDSYGRAVALAIKVVGRVIGDPKLRIVPVRLPIG